jgi:hypothetical protein
MEFRRSYPLAGVSSKKHRAAEVSTVGIHGANFGLQGKTAKKKLQEREIVSDPPR